LIPSESLSPTVYDVAKKADVSVATVSRVINGHFSILEQTRARVLKVIEELGYEPNASARNMARIRFDRSGEGTSHE